MVFQADYRIYLLWCVRCGGDCDCCVIRVSDGMNSLKKNRTKKLKNRFSFGFIAICV